VVNKLKGTYNQSRVWEEVFTLFFCFWWLLLCWRCRHAKKQLEKSF